MKRGSSFHTRFADFVAALGALNGNGLYRLMGFNPRFPAGGIIWEGSGMALLGLHHSSVSCLSRSALDVSSQPLLQPPACLTVMDSSSELRSHEMLSSVSCLGHGVTATGK